MTSPNSSPEYFRGPSFIPDEVFDAFPLDSTEAYEAVVIGIETRIHTFDGLFKDTAHRSLDDPVMTGLIAMEGCFRDELVGFLRQTLPLMDAITERLSVSRDPTERDVATSLLCDLHEAYVTRGVEFNPGIEAARWDRFMSDSGNFGGRREYTIRSSAEHVLRRFLLPCIDRAIGEGGQNDRWAEFRTALRLRVPSSER